MRSADVPPGAAEAPPRAAEAPIIVELVDRDQPLIRLPGPVIRIGRSPSADVAFPARETGVSANHAKLISRGGELVIFDTESRAGLYLNGRRVVRAKLCPGDLVRLGPTGPALRFRLGASEPAAVVPAGSTPAGPAQSSASAGPAATWFAGAAAARGGGGPGLELATSVGAAEVLGEFPLGPRPLAIGRAPGCEVKLDSLHVSARHAEVWREPDGSARVRDLRSTNGTFVGGVRIEESKLAPDTELIVGPYFLRYTGASLLLFDTRGRTWVEARGVEHWIGDSLLLDGISLALQPGEFVGLLGPSGAGKSMLLKALCGTLRASGGRVLVNGLDFYAQYAVLKTLVGYVPQDDIIHGQLTPADTLRYAAELRLSPEASWLIRQARVEEVLSALELQDRSQLPAWQLSGGQRKRLSIGVELLNEPNLLYLDEPTAGLDPNLEEKMMVLFRELALRGKIVCCVTHTLDHIELCDKIALLYGGRLAYFGPPRGALAYFGVRQLADAYHILEEHEPDHWKQELQRRSGEAAEPSGARAPSEVRARARSSGPGALRQLHTLSRRYLRILTVDLRHTLILLLQAPILGALIGLATRGGTPGWRPTSVTFLMLSLSAFWCGCVNSAREITKEAAVTTRERLVGVGVVPYVLSKLVVLQLVVLLQVAMMLLLADTLGPPRRLAEGGSFAVILGGVPGSYLLALLNLYLTGLGGAALGLVISSVAGNSDKAMSLVPLALLPQILFAGVLTVPRSGTFTRLAGYLTSVNWSFDLFRRQIACTPEELWARTAPECLASLDPNRAGEVMGHVRAPGREIVLLIKDGLYSMPADLAALAGMVALFVLVVLALEWQKVFRLGGR